MTENTIPEPIDLNTRRARRTAEEASPAPAEVPATAEAASDVAYEVELDERPVLEGVPVPVDVPPVAEGERRPIIPAHLLPANIGGTIKHTLGRWAYVAEFHAVRTPVYAVKVTAFAARGLFRLIGQQIGWWWVRNQFALLQHAADTHDTKEWTRLHREIKKHPHLARHRLGR